MCDLSQLCPVLSLGIVICSLLLSLKVIIMNGCIKDKVHFHEGILLNSRDKRTTHRTRIGLFATETVILEVVWDPGSASRTVRRLPSIS